MPTAKMPAFSAHDKPQDSGLARRTDAHLADLRFEPLHLGVVVAADAHPIAHQHFEDAAEARQPDLVADEIARDVKIAARAREKTKEGGPTGRPLG
jgi:hypothetical protein